MDDNYQMNKGSPAWNPFYNYPNMNNYSDTGESPLFSRGSSINQKMGNNKV